MSFDDNNNFKSPLADLIDDETYGRFDKRKSALYYGQYFEEGKQANIKAKAIEKTLEGIKKRKPGRTLKDVALVGAVANILFADGDKEMCSGPNGPNRGHRSWTSEGKAVPRPQQMGLERYDGSPREAARIVKHAAKAFGAFRVGITGLDKRHVYKYDCDGKEIVFEDVDEPYETEEKRVIPEKCKYVVVMLVHMSAEALGCAPFPVGSMVPLFTYIRADVLVDVVANFLRGLGYTAIPSVNDTAPNGPFANEAGLGEQGRADKTINPEGGALVRICKVFTDLPMELDTPKRFGIAEFCRVCRRCVEACPVNTIDDEQEPSFETPGPWSNPGHKTWHGHNPRCWAYAESMNGGCGICLSVCPWNKPDNLLHRTVKAVIKRTPIFNRLLVRADKLLGYGKPMDPEKWWTLDLPTYGINTCR